MYKRQVWSKEQILDYFPRLKERMDVAADCLSGGEQQMVAVKRAMSGNVKLLLLDEPFEGLAPAVILELFKVFDLLRRHTSKQYRPEALAEGRDFIFHLRRNLRIGMAHDHTVGLQFAQLKGQYPLCGVGDGSRQFHEPLLASEEMKQDQRLPHAANDGQCHSTPLGEKRL